MFLSYVYQFADSYLNDHKDKSLQIKTNCKITHMHTYSLSHTQPRIAKESRLLKRFIKFSICCPNIHISVTLARIY